MDLHIPQGIEITDDLFSARKFLKYSYLNFIMMYPTILNRVLNEYIYFMNRYHNMYTDRIRPEKNKELDMKIFSPFHVMDFMFIVYIVSVISTDDHKESKSFYKYLLNFVNDHKNAQCFYEYLLNFVDDNLQERFYYGKKFSHTEKQILQNACDNCDDVIGRVCSYDKIKIIFKNNEFDIDKFREKQSHGLFYRNISIESTKKKTIITMNNTDHGLAGCELWCIQSCSDHFMTLSINYVKTTTDVLYIDAINWDTI